MPDASLYSQKTITAMREWIADCLGGWHDLHDDADVAELTDQDVVDGVHTHFDGGVLAFLAAEDASLTHPRPGELIRRSTLYELMVDREHDTTCDTHDQDTAMRQAKLLADQGHHVRAFSRDVTATYSRRRPAFWVPTPTRTLNAS